jgi:hypothetical protein
VTVLHRTGVGSETGVMGHTKARELVGDWDGYEYCTAAVG